MPSAYVDAAQITFPPKCPHCGQLPDAVREITAHRLRDAVLGEYVPALTVTIPACRASVRRRKRLGAITVVAELALILLGGFLTMALVMDGHRIEAAILGAQILVVVALARTGRDAELLDWWVLGVRARRVSGPGVRLHVSMRRDAYFSEWASVNPGASTSGGAIGWRPPPPPPEDPNAPLDPIIYNRTIPAIALVVSAVTVALHHWYAVNGGHVFLAPLCLLTAVGGLAIGGGVFSPLVWVCRAPRGGLPGAP